MITASRTNLYVIKSLIDCLYDAQRFKANHKTRSKLCCADFTLHLEQYRFMLLFCEMIYRVAVGASIAVWDCLSDMVVDILRGYYDLSKIDKCDLVYRVFQKSFRKVDANISITTQEI